MVKEIKSTVSRTSRSSSGRSRGRGRGRHNSSGSSEKANQTRWHELKAEVDEANAKNGGTHNNIDEYALGANKYLDPDNKWHENDMHEEQWLVEKAQQVLRFVHDLPDDAVGDDKWHASIRYSTSQLLKPYDQLSEDQKKELINDAFDSTGWFEHNIAGTGVYAARLKDENRSVDQKLAFLFFDDLRAARKVSWGSDTMRFVTQGVLTDAGAWLTAFTGGLSKAGTIAAQKGLKKVATKTIVNQISKSVLNKGVVKAAGKAAAVGAIEGTIHDGIKQNAKMTGMDLDGDGVADLHYQKEFSIQQSGVSAVFGGAFGGAFGAAGYGAKKLFQSQKFDGIANRFATRKMERAGGAEGSYTPARDATSPATVRTIGSGGDKAFEHEVDHLILDMFSRSDAPGVRRMTAKFLNHLGVEGQSYDQVLTNWSKMSVRQQRGIHERFTKAQEIFRETGTYPKDAVVAGFLKQVNAIKSGKGMTHNVDAVRNQLVRDMDALPNVSDAAKTARAQEIANIYSMIAQRSGRSLDDVVAGNKVKFEHLAETPTDLLADSFAKSGRTPINAPSTLESGYSRAAIDAYNSIHEKKRAFSKTKVEREFQQAFDAVYDGITDDGKRIKFKCSSQEEKKLFRKYREAANALQAERLAAKTLGKKLKAEEITPSDSATGGLKLYTMDRGVDWLNNVFAYVQHLHINNQTVRDPTKALDEQGFLAWTAARFHDLPTTGLDNLNNIHRSTSSVFEATGVHKTFLSLDKQMQSIADARKRNAISQSEAQKQVNDLVDDLQSAENLAAFAKANADFKRIKRHYEKWKTKADYASFMKNIQPDQLDAALKTIDRYIEITGELQKTAPDDKLGNVGAHLFKALKNNKDFEHNDLRHAFNELDYIGHSADLRIKDPQGGTKLALEQVEYDARMWEMGIYTGVRGKGTMRPDWDSAKKPGKPSNIESIFDVDTFGIIDKLRDKNYTWSPDDDGQLASCFSELIDRKMYSELFYVAREYMIRTQGSKLTKYDFRGKLKEQYPHLSDVSKSSTADIDPLQKLMFDKFMKFTRQGDKEGGGTLGRFFGLETKIGGGDETDGMRMLLQDHLDKTVFTRLSDRYRGTSPRSRPGKIMLKGWFWGKVFQLTKQAAGRIHYRIKDEDGNVTKEKWGWGRLPEGAELVNRGFTNQFAITRKPKEWLYSGKTGLITTPIRYLTRPVTTAGYVVTAPVRYLGKPLGTAAGAWIGLGAAATLVEEGLIEPAFGEDYELDLGKNMISSGLTAVNWVPKAYGWVSGAAAHTALEVGHWMGRKEYEGKFSDATAAGANTFGWALNRAININEALFTDTVAKESPEKDAAPADDAPSDTPSQQQPSQQQSPSTAPFIIPAGAVFNGATGGQGGGAGGSVSSNPSGGGASTSGGASTGSTGGSGGSSTTSTAEQSVAASSGGGKKTGSSGNSLSDTWRDMVGDDVADTLSGMFSGVTDFAGSAFTALKNSKNPWVKGGAAVLAGLLGVKLLFGGKEMLSGLWKGTLKIGLFAAIAVGLWAWWRPKGADTSEETREIKNPNYRYESGGTPPPRTRYQGQSSRRRSGNETTHVPYKDPNLLMAEFEGQDHDGVGVELPGALKSDIIVPIAGHGSGKYVANDAIGVPDNVIQMTTSPHDIDNDVIGTPHVTKLENIVPFKHGHAPAMSA